jgi:hypothetical protein
MKKTHHSTSITVITLLIGGMLIVTGTKVVGQQPPQTSPLPLCQRIKLLVAVVFQVPPYPETGQALSCWRTAISLPQVAIHISF